MGSRLISRNPIIVPVPPPSTISFGPDGTEWPDMLIPQVSAWTPIPVVADSHPVDVVATPSTWKSVIAGVTTAQANAGYVIGLADGEYASTRQTVPENTALKAASKAIIVRAINPGQATFSAAVDWQVSNAFLAYAQGSGGWRQGGTGTTNSGFLRCYWPGSSSFVLSGNGHIRCGLIGVIAPDRYSTSGDRLHWDSQTSTATPPKDPFVIRNWIEGIDDDGTGGHTDTQQWTAAIGTITETNSYFGAAGSNGTTQIKADQQNGFPVPAYVADTCWYGGASIAKATQGNSSSQMGTDTRNNCVFHSPTSSNGPFKVNPSPSLPPVVSNSLFYGSVPSGLDPSSSGNTTTPVDYSFVIPPLFVKPPWAWW